MKKILSLVLVLAMLAGINSFSVYAEESSSAGIDVSGFTYIVNNMEFYNTESESSEVPVTGGEVGVTVIKRADKETDASLIVSTYTDGGKMLGMYDVELDLLLGENMTAYFELSAPEGDEVGEVRAYVWESFNSPTPLSNVCSDENPNDIQDPCVEEPEIKIPSVNTDFSDIPPESDYALAVKTVAELGIMNGYEDGNFYPENTITRAEAAYLTVKIAGRQKAAAYLKAEEYFEDVPADHWAAAAINYCYAKGYLVTDGTSFEPEKVISATEFIKMLVDVTGYSLYAESEGGYSVGYICVAEDMGLLDGLNIENYSSLKRSEVAVLIANAINMPIAEKVYMSYEDGKLSYSIAKMDGTGGYYYKSLLTEVYNAYLVEGRVQGNYKTGYMRPDEIEFEIVKTENYENQDFGINYPTVIVYADVGDTDSSLYEVGSYLRAIIRVDENDDYVILSAADSGKNKVYEFDCSLLDTSDYEYSDGTFISGAFAQSNDDFLMVKETETTSKSTRHKLQTDNYGELDVDLYVNGAPIYSATREQIEQYVLLCELGNIKLVDTYKTDGLYDTIHVNCYVTAEILMIDTSTGKIYLDENAPSTVITLDSEDEDLVYSISLDSEEISVADLQAGDILTIAYDVTAGGTEKAAFVNSLFYEIYVSRDTVSGKVTSRNENEGTVVVGGETYTFVNYYEELTMAEEYVLVLDFFGRIYDYYLDPTAIKYAVIDNFSCEEGAYVATLYTEDGQEKVCVFDGDVVDENGNTLYSGTQAENYIYKMVYDDNSNKTDIINRVVEYRISASAYELTKVKFLPCKANSVLSDGSFDVYSEKNARIGYVKLNSDTRIIDACDYVAGNYNNLSVCTINDLVNGGEYAAYAYGYQNSDGTYPFVLITSKNIINSDETENDGSDEGETETAYNANTSFAVVTGAASDDTDVYGNIVYSIPVLYESETTTLMVSDNAEGDSVTDLKRGDVIFFVTDKGYVNKIDVIFSFDGEPAYSDLVATLVENNNKAIIDNGIVRYPTLDDGSLYPNFAKEWYVTENRNNAIQLVFGPIMYKEGDVFSLGTITNNSTNGLVTYKYNDISDEGGCYEIDISDETNVYVYDYYEKKKDYRLATGTKGSIIASSFSDANNANDGDTILWDNEANKECVNFAFAKVVGGEATDVFVFLAE